MKNRLKKALVGLTGLAMITSLAACQRDAANPSGSTAEGDGLKVALVVNQRFGDNGPMDDLAAGADRAEKDFGVSIKRLESSSSANFEADVRAMANDGYDLIFTTFPYMTDATTMVSKEFPDVKFGAIFQNINGGGTSVPNVWDTEFHGEGAFYLAGYMAGLTTESNNVGMIIGGEEPTPNAEGNAFMRGALAANKDITVQSSFVGSYEDPAKAKEIADAMIAKGADYLQGDAGASDAGIVEIAKEKGVLVSTEITDFWDQYDGFTGIVKIGFGNTLYDGVEAAVEGKFPGGEHTIRDLTNGGYYIDWDSFQRFADKNVEHGKRMADAIPQAKDVEKEIIDGELKIEFETEVPDWSAIKAG